MTTRETKWFGSPVYMSDLAWLAPHFLMYVMIFPIGVGAFVGLLGGTLWGVSNPIISALAGSMMAPIVTYLFLLRSDHSWSFTDREWLDWVRGRNPDIAWMVIALADWAAQSERPSDHAVRVLAERWRTLVLAPPFGHRDE